MAQLISALSGRFRLARRRGAPLVIAVHGGTYTSAYFDLPGRSLLDAAEANAVPIVAIDRPGYGDSPMLATQQMDITGQAAFLTGALATIWQDYGTDCSGMVLVGHSIGAAIAATIASAPGNLPLQGLAISGLGLTTTPGDFERWQALPDIPLVAMPPEIKDQVMFGPEAGYDADMPEAGHIADAPGPKAELLAITGAWSQTAGDVLGRIAVPVHYRQGEFDRLWIVSENEVMRFGAALVASPMVDAQRVPGTGHCIDHHRFGPALHLQQLGFALACSVGAYAATQ